jgi:cellulose synthase/poly-beta-1,6-N-acetylglucosamine synthase-like glycosyltransferase
VQSRNYEVEHTYTFNFIIHSQSDEQTLPALIDSIKKQEYKKEKINTNIILDNCSDNTSKILEIMGGTKIWRISTEDGFKGKNASVRWLLERIFFQDTSDIYVFLSSDVVLKSDFVAKLNKEMNSHKIVTGMTLSKVATPSLLNQIVSFRKFFLVSITFIGRNIAGLTNALNEDFYAIKRDLLKEAEYNFDNESTPELEIPLRLINKNINIKYSKEVRVYKQYQENFEAILKSFNRLTVSKIKLLLKYRKEILDISMDLKAKEFLLSVIYPNESIIILMCIFITAFSVFNSYLFGYKVPYFVTNCYVLSFIYAGFIFNVDARKTFYWICWNILSPFALLLNFGLNYKQFLNIPSEKTEAEKSQFCENSKVVDVILTDGAREITSKLEMICESSLYQVIFWFNNKKMSSQKSFKMSDALREIIDKLIEYGFALKVCQNCGFFELDSRGRTISDCGKCYMGVVKQETQDPDATHIWESCENIIPSHAKEFVKKELAKLTK